MTRGVVLRGGPSCAYPVPMSDASLTTSTGDPVSDGDPRIPRPSKIASEKAVADELADIARKIPGARIQDVEMAARLDALISLVVPPDGPGRAVYEYRVQENRGANFARVIEAYQNAKAEAERPKLIIAQAVPT